MIRIALAAALLVTAGAASAAAPAAADLSIGEWQKAVETQLDAKLRQVGDRRIVRSEAGTVLVRLAADGRIADVTMAKGTGVPALDREAMAAARLIRFPGMPEGHGRRPLTVAMNVFFGTSDEAIARRVQASGAEADAAVQRFAARRTATQIAAR